MTEALNVTELREQWEPDRVLIEVEGVENATMFLWYVSVGLTPAFLAVLGAVVSLGDPVTTALGLGGGMVLGTAWLAAMALVQRWLAADDVVLGHDRQHLLLGPFQVPLHEVVDLRWSGRHLQARDRSGQVHLSPAVRVRDRDRLLRILRSALPAEEDRDAVERAREDVHAQLEPLKARA